MASVTLAGVLLLANVGSNLGVDGISTVQHDAYESAVNVPPSGRTCADNVCGVLDFLSKSKRSAALKAHCLLAQAQLARAVRRRRHLLTETMRDAAHLGASALRGIAKVP